MLIHPLPQRIQISAQSSNKPTKGILHFSYSVLLISNISFWFFSLGFPSVFPTLPSCSYILFYSWEPKRLCSFKFLIWSFQCPWHVWYRCLFCIFKLCSIFWPLKCLVIFSWYPDMMHWVKEICVSGPLVMWW